MNKSSEKKQRLVGWKNDWKKGRKKKIKKIKIKEILDTNPVSLDANAWKKIVQLTKISPNCRWGQSA